MNLRLHAAFVLWACAFAVAVTPTHIAAITEERCGVAERVLGPCPSLCFAREAPKGDLKNKHAAWFFGTDVFVPDVASDVQPEAVCCARDGPAWSCHGAIEPAFVASGVGLTHMLPHCSGSGTTVDADGCVRWVPDAATQCVLHYTVRTPSALPRIAVGVLIACILVFALSILVQVWSPAGRKAAARARAGRLLDTMQNDALRRQSLEQHLGRGAARNVPPWEQKELLRRLRAADSDTPKSLKRDTTLDVAGVH
jgi:hypothetical protein